jgi:hypothetical protein
VGRRRLPARAQGRHCRCLGFVEVPWRRGSGIVTATGGRVVPHSCWSPPACRPVARADGGGPARPRCLLRGGPGIRFSPTPSIRALITHNPGGLVARTSECTACHQRAAVPVEFGRLLRHSAVASRRSIPIQSEPARSTSAILRGLPDAVPLWGSLETFRHVPHRHPRYQQ